MRTKQWRRLRIKRKTNKTKKNTKNIKKNNKDTKDESPAVYNNNIQMRKKDTHGKSVYIINWFEQ